MARSPRPCCLCTLLCLAALAAAPAATLAQDGTRVVVDVRFAQAGEHRLLLDLHLPRPARDAAAKPPLVIWIHGGAWRGGSRKDMPLTGLVERGYAVASVEYRLSTAARFPAQVHDLKAAVRFLRAKQAEFGYDAARVAVAGNSAGGHLAALVGVTNRHRDLEGVVGDHLDQSSDVHAIISLYGMSNLTTILAQSTPHGLSVRVPALELLLGARPDQAQDLARLASPVFHVDADDPPLLLIHGDQDPQAPINQSHELQGRYEAHKLPHRFVVLHDSRHGGPEFFDAERCGLMHQFLSEHLRTRGNVKPG